MEHTYLVQQPANLQAVSSDILARCVVEGKSLVITLQGELGAGKTTFTQQLGRQLGIEEPITSPTFTIMKQYFLNHERFDALVHIDAYRLESEAEAAPLRLEEVFAAPHMIICVEWPERIPNVLPKDVVTVRLSIEEGETRRVTVECPESGRVA